MTWTPTATRADVLRLIARFVQLEFSIRSQAGKLVIHESRASKRGPEIDIESASEVEILDAIKTAEIRRLVYAPAKAPTYLDKSGEPLRSVIPSREVAPIVRGRATRGVVQIDDAREWRATISQKLRRLDREEAEALIIAERLRIELRVMRNQLAAARSAAGRAKSGGRNARNLRRHAEARVAEIRSLELIKSDRLKSTVRTNAYNRGIDHLLEACTETRDVEAYCFGNLSEE